MVPDMDLNSSFASRIVREELTETKEGGSMTQKLYGTTPRGLAGWAPGVTLHLGARSPEPGQKM